MKKLLFLFVLLTLTKIGFSQYVHFPDSNAVWSVWQQKFFVNGDSVYNGNSYKKYYMSTNQTLANANFFSLLREDTVSRQIYTINSTGQERLLYDFSLSVNDTVTVYPKPYFTTDSFLVKVESVDSVSVLGQLRRRLKIIGYNMMTGIDEYWIEGIGSTMGIFYSGHTAFMIFDVPYPTLLCYEKENILHFQNPDFNSCYEPFPTSINDVTASNEVKLFPNPSIDRIYLTKITQGNTLSIYNNFGQLQQTFTNLDNSGIDIGNLAKGFYTYSVTDKHQNIKTIGKFIKE